MIPGIGGLAGGGLSASASSSAATGDARSGDIGGSQFTFGGINTGTQSAFPTWAIVAALAVAAFIAWRKFR